jgi:hypothetical protein
MYISEGRLLFIEFCIAKIKLKKECMKYLVPFQIKWGGKLILRHFACHFMTSGNSFRKEPPWAN